MEYRRSDCIEVGSALRADLAASKVGTVLRTVRSAGSESPPYHNTSKLLIRSPFELMPLAPAN